jgi:hypothetical protein
MFKATADNADIGEDRPVEMTTDKTAFRQVRAGEIGAGEIGVHKGSVLDGVDALYSIIQMPPGIPVATVAINGAMNAAILAVQMLALSDKELAEAFTAYKEGLKKKIVKANEDLKEVKYEYKTN